MTRILLAATLLSSMVASATDFDIDPIHSYVGFTVRHMMVVDQRGNFTKFSGALKYDAREPTKSTVEVNIDLASVDTREPSLKTGTSATTTISRKDFGLTWNKALETGGIAVGDEVKISLDLELNRRK